MSLPGYPTTIILAKTNKQVWKTGSMGDWRFIKEQQIHFMFKLWSLTLLFLICCCVAFSQTVLKGKVISEDSQKPLASVSVYLNITSLGAITNEAGMFIIRGIPS